jgi:hypothetical protein
MIQRIMRISTKPKKKKAIKRAIYLIFQFAIQALLISETKKPLCFSEQIKKATTENNSETGFC